MGRHRAAFVFLRGAALLLAITAASAATVDKPLAEADRLVLKRNYNKAAAVLERAARAGNPAAQYRLASLYRLGVGVAADETRAKAWLNKASAAGNKKAAQLLRRLNGSEVPETKTVDPPRLTVEANSAPPVVLQARDTAGNSWVQRAAARGQIGVIAPFLGPRDLTDREPAAGETPLMLAIKWANGSSAAELLKRGAFLNVTDSKGRSPLLLAAAYGDPSLVNALIDAGADTSHQDKEGATALIHALEHCKAENAELLLRRQSPLLADKSGQSPLHLAVRYCSRLDVIESLAALQVADAADSKGRTPLWYAAAVGDVAAIEVLAGKQAQPGVTDVDGLTPLHAAAQRGQAKAIQELLAMGADPESVAASGNSPLLLAAAAQCALCIDPLARSGSTIDGQNKFGDTALIAAVRAFSAETIMALIKAGADPSLRNARRETALSIAERLERNDLVALMKGK